MDLDQVNRMEEKFEEELDRYMAVFTEVEKLYIQKVARQIQALGYIGPSAGYRLETMVKMTEDIGEIRQALQKALRIGSKQLDDLFWCYLETRPGLSQYLPEIKKGSGVVLQMELPKLERKLDREQVEQMVKSAARQTQATMENLSNTTAVSDSYHKAVDKAIISVQSGLASPMEAVREAIKEAGSAGIPVVYASGYHRRMDTAIRSNVLTAVNQLAQDVASAAGKQLGTDAYEISAHMAPAPDHAPVQGHVLYNADYEAMQAGDAFKDVDGRSYEGFRRPIGQWNCMHFANPVFSDMVRTYTEKQLKTILEKNEAGFDWRGKHYTIYEGQQMMRKLETEIRREKVRWIASETIDDDEMMNVYQTEIESLNRKYVRLSDACGLPCMWERTVVDGYAEKKRKLS